MTNVLAGPDATVTDAAAINAAVAANAILTNAEVTNIVATNAVVTNVVATNAARVHHAVTVGDCIELAGEQRSEGGVAFVTQLNADGTFDVRWVLANRGETRVRPQRIVELNPLATTARRTSASVLERPSILCPSHRPTRRALIDASSRLNVPRAAAGPASVSAVILQSKQWSRHDAVPNPMLEYLHNGREQSAGWLRRSEAALRGISLVDKKGNEKKHLLPEENSILVHVKEEVDRVMPMKKLPKGYTPKADVRHGFGVSKTKVSDCVVKFYMNNASSKRKKNSNVGQTVFNSEKKRKSIFTPLEYFKRLQRKRHNESISEGQLGRAFNMISADVLRQCELGAESLRRVVVNIEDEISRVMQRTRGAISWGGIAEAIAGGPDEIQPVSKTALRRHIMATNDFRYTATKTLPQCNNERSRKWRKCWAIGFHLFWEGAKLVRKSVQVLYFHIDEKWFLSLVVRMYGKVAPAFGCQPIYHRIHHKNSVDKILAICAVGIAPFENDLRKGGEAHKIEITRCGGMVEAQKDSFKRVYRDDGSYHYPKLPENRLREKGKEYFENWEITGSKEMHKKTRKFALTAWIRNNFMPKLVDLAQRLEQKYNKTIHIRGQWDNATPHKEKVLLRLIADLFGDLGWEWTTQPANTPLSNVMDAALFPALAKGVSKIQGLFHEGRYLQCEKLWEVLKQAWAKYPEDKIARSFVHHAQVAAAIYDCDGGDEFVRQHKGLSFGVRRVCRPYYGENDTGEEMDLTSLAPRTLADAKGVVVEELEDGVDFDGEGRKLKYGVPDMREHDIEENMSFDSLHLICGDPGSVDYFNLPEAERERYDQFMEAYYAKCKAGQCTIKPKGFCIVVFSQPARSHLSLIY